MEIASSSKYVVLVAPQEYADNSVIIRNMKDGSEKQVKVDDMLNLSANKYWHDIFSQIVHAKDAETKNQHIRNFFEDVLEPRRLRELLEDFLFVIASLTANQSYSYFHDNGFHKITLYVDTENLMKLTLELVGEKVDPKKQGCPMQLY